MALTEKLTAVADAIRARSGKTDKLTLSQMPQEIAAIKGGVDLNFQVIWGDCPDTAAENTVWVDTASVESWVFSPAAPETPAEGMVWFLTGNLSPAAFNALEENAITLCPVSARQYEAGAWILKTARIYQSGWKDFAQYLYRDGETFDSVTGGYYSSSEDNELLADSVKIHVNSQTQSHIRTKNKIDLTNLSTLHLRTEDFTSTKTEVYIYFCVTENVFAEFSEAAVSDGAVVTYYAAEAESGTNPTLSLDVSGITGEKHIYVVTKNTWKYTQTTYYIKEIWGQ